jgi:WD40 repeat protein
MTNKVHLVATLLALTCLLVSPPLSAQPKLRFTLQGHTAPVTDVAFSPDGKMVATGSEDQAIILWDVTTHKPRATLTGHTRMVLVLRFSPDG